MPHLDFPDNRMHTKEFMKLMLYYDLGEILHTEKLQNANSFPSDITGHSKHREIKIKLSLPMTTA